MAQRQAAVHRGMAASREATPSHSRSASRSASREALNSEILPEGSVVNFMLDNHGSITANGNRNNNLLSPCQNERSASVGQRGWCVSSSNITSTDSTPSSDHTTDSGQATDSSPIAGPLAALGFPQNSNGNNTCLYRMPIVGYEVLEERSRFTVFKIQVFHQPTGDQWFVFRRYTDFVRLNRRLKGEFPGLRFALPPKRWFGDNFDPVFLEDRQLGLQAFIDNIIGHARIREKKCVRDFFCLDDPPNAHDSLEESRAICQTLEDSIADLQEQLREKDGEIAILRSQVNFLMAQQQTLVKALRLECELKSSEGNINSSTHDLNLALLSICEKTIHGGLNNASHISSSRNGMNNTSGGNTPVSTSRQTSSVDSPLRRTLEKAFLNCSDSHVALRPNCRVAGAVSTPNSVEGSIDEAEDR